MKEDDKAKGLSLSLCSLSHIKDFTIRTFIRV